MHFFPTNPQAFILREKKMSLYLIFHFNTQGNDCYTKQEESWPFTSFVLIKKKKMKKAK